MKTVLLRAAGIACLVIVLLVMALVMASIPYITHEWGGWAAIGALFGNAAAFRPDDEPARALVRRLTTC